MKSSILGMAAFALCTSGPLAVRAQVISTSSVKHAKVPFAVGEKMEYDVKFGVLRVGNAHGNSIPVG